jgi:tight adherence protein B
MTTVLVVGIVVWLGSMAIWWMVSNASRSADIEKVKSRLLGTPKAKKGKAAGGQPALFELEPKTQGQIIVGLLKRYNLNDRAQAWLEQAGLKWKVHKLANLCLACCLAGYAVCWLFAPEFLKPYSLMGGGIGSVFPLLYVSRLRKRRLFAFEGVFPDALEFVARSMRAGHAFSVSLEMIHREFQEPLASEFKRTFEEHNLGLPLDVSLQKLSARVPLLDVQFFVSAVMLQKRTGGNLAEILDKLAYVIRERFKLRGRIRAVSAHGRMTGTALTCIPIAVAVITWFTNSEYVSFFFNDDVGHLMLAGAVGMQVLGYLIICKIVQIEV